jgi:Domain of unknown function (DUF397)
MTQGGWRKSSYSGQSGENDCVEVGWHKSSYSGASGTGDCVEVAVAAGAVGVRDSKNTSGPTLAFSPTAWRTYTRSTTAAMPWGQVVDGEAAINNSRSGAPVRRSVSARLRD